MAGDPRYLGWEGDGEPIYLIGYCLGNFSPETSSLMTEEKGHRWSYKAQMTIVSGHARQ